MTVFGIHPETKPLSIDEITIINSWEHDSAVLRKEVIAFWQRHKALPAEANAEERAKEVLFVGKNAAGEVVGVCTVFNAMHRRIEHRMFHFRSFVAPQARRNSLARDFLLRSKSYLELYNRKLPANQQALGLILEVEAEILKNGSPTVRRACWKETRMVFIGRNQRGAHLRVCYFDDALLNF